MKSPFPGMDPYVERFWREVYFCLVTYTADVPLDLQALVDLCCENGRYDDTDYRVEPHPPLDPADAAWTDEHLRAQGRR